MIVTMDFYPTILNATGAKGNADHNQEVDGLNLSAILKDPNASLGRDTCSGTSPMDTEEAGRHPMLRFVTRTTG